MVFVPHHSSHFLCATAERLAEVHGVGSLSAYRCGGPGGFRAPGRPGVCQGFSHESCLRLAPLRPNYLLVDINVSLQVWRPFGALQLAVPIAVCVFSPVKSP